MDILFVARELRIKLGKEPRTQKHNKGANKGLCTERSKKVRSKEEEEHVRHICASGMEQYRK